MTTYRWAVVDCETDDVLNNTIASSEQETSWLGKQNIVALTLSSMDKEWERMLRDGEYRVAKFKLVECEEGEGE